MTVIEPDLESFRKPVLATVPAKFESKWGKGTWRRSWPPCDATARTASPTRSCAAPCRATLLLSMLACRHASASSFRRAQRPARLVRRACALPAGLDRARRLDHRDAAALAYPHHVFVDRLPRAGAQGPRDPDPDAASSSSRRCWSALRLRARSSAPGTSKSVSLPLTAAFLYLPIPAGRRGAHPAGASRDRRDASAAPLPRCPRPRRRCRCDDI